MRRLTEEERWTYKKRALAGYEAGSAAYDGLYLEEQERKYRRSLAYLRQRAGGLLLDCGCGTGMLLAQMLGRSGLLVGVDYSKAMLGLARRRVGMAANVGLICGDAECLPFRSGVFDQVVSFTMLGNVPDLPAAIQEMARVGRDSAQILLSFVKKNIEPDEVLRFLNEEAVSLKEFIDDIDLSDWIVIGEKKTRT
jgi:ubiquinone/menaquinone biosynthesis C-methylase UbiE